MAVATRLARGRAVLFGTLPAMAWALMALNLLDAVCTLAYLQSGVARELNPLMRMAFAVSPALFLATKLLAVQMGIWVLARCQPWSRLARLALSAGVAVYGVLAAYHLAFAASLLS